MQGYRLYFIDADNHVRRAVDMFCHDDAEAMKRALGRSDGVHGLELWRGDDLVKRWSDPPLVE